MSVPPRRLRMASTRAGSRGAASGVQSGMRKGSFPVLGEAGELIKAGKIAGFATPHPERWQSGRMRLTRNQVYGNVTGVRIPPSPPDSPKTPGSPPGVFVLAQQLALWCRIALRSRRGNIRNYGRSVNRF